MQTVTIGGLVIKEGDWISLNGSTGEVILGKQPLSPPALSGDLETFMSWADKVRRLKVNSIFVVLLSRLILIRTYNFLRVRNILTIQLRK